MTHAPHVHRVQIYYEDTDHSGLVIDATDIRSELGFLAPLGFAECRT